MRKPAEMRAFSNARKSKGGCCVKDKELWDLLLAHKGHELTVATYGDPDNPQNVSLECLDCNEVVLDAELYTICAREEDAT